jgi:hypothetical protein
MSQQLKLSCSPKCKMVESNFCSQRYIIEESLVESIPVMKNFRILRTRKHQYYDRLVVIEVNIGFLMVIKRIDKERINEISNELLLYKLIHLLLPFIRVCRTKTKNTCSYRSIMTIH